MKYNGQRLKVSRILSGISSPHLAELVGITKQAIWQYEKGYNPPSIDIAQKIAIELNFPLQFFYQEDLEFKNMGEAFCRASCATIKKAKEQEKIKNIIRLKVYEFLKTYFKIPYMELPNFLDKFCLDDSVDIENTALELRNFLDLGQLPIDNMVNLLENMGFMLSTFSYEKTKLDAISQIPDIKKNNIRSISYNTSNTTFSKVQFSLAHELGHWVLQHLNCNDFEIDDEYDIYKKLEDDANLFASAFLLPKQAFITDLTNPTDLNNYVILKSKWKVSIAAMIYRARSLNLITQDEFSILYRKMSRRGWRVSDPYDNIGYIPKPTVFKKGLDMLTTNNVIEKDKLIYHLQKNCEVLYAKQFNNILGLENDFISEGSSYCAYPNLTLLK